MCVGELACKDEASGVGEWTVGAVWNVEAFIDTQNKPDQDYDDFNREAEDVQAGS